MNVFTERVSVCVGQFTRHTVVTRLTRWSIDEAAKKATRCGRRRKRRETWTRGTKSGERERVKVIKGEQSEEQSSRRVTVFTQLSPCLTRTVRERPARGSI